MHLTSVDLKFADANGRPRLLHAATINGYGWYVRAHLEGRVFTRHCSDWQAVERAVRWLKAHSHETATPAGDRATALRPLAAAMAVGLLLIVATAAAAQIFPDEQAVLQFQRNADQYAFLHRQVERRLGPIPVNADPATIAKAIDAMAWGMRAARPDARQGDIITPDVQEALRARIVRAMRQHQHTAPDLHAEEMIDFGDMPAEPLKVNGTFPWKVGTAMFPCILEVLPKLPGELMYRLVGNDLILIDVHASLIVDIVPLAIVETTIR